MSSTLQIESFGETNLRERTELSADYIPASLVLEVKSSDGYLPGQSIYVGQLAREGCEKAVIASVANETTINLVQALKLPHTRYDPVVAVLGDLIHVYRAANVNGAVPEDVAFSVLATRSIDPDQQSTYYSDSAGNSSFWYRFTYYNAVTLEETDLADSVAVRGDDFGHYASVSEIRVEAGFENAFNLKDSTVDQQRRTAETEINASLSGAYNVPFSPVPEIIHTLTIQLAAALLLTNAYGETTGNKQKLKDARAAIDGYKNRSSVLTDSDGTALTTADSVSGYPGEPSAEAPRYFRMSDRF
jgi:phage gp36-like protein